MHRLWSDGRWNKLTLAHGCYWKKCAFCDVSLDYIGRYDRPSRRHRGRAHRALIAETGQTGFHLVDEAAPPAGMRALAKRLLDESLSITWWGNIRFEKTFTPELCELLAQSGCVAVSGGLEVASDRLLALMKKGVTVEQVARVTRAFTDAGIMVHAYLMYGFPERDRAGHGRCARARAAAVRGGLLAVRLLAPLQRDGAFADRPAPRALRHHAQAAAEDRVRAQRRRVSRPRRHRPRLSRRGPAQGALQLHARRSASTPTFASWFEPPHSSSGRARGQTARRRTAAVPKTTVAPDLIARCLAQ